jgi:hypothetical protein
VRCSKQTDEVALEVGAEVADVFARVFADSLHLADMAFALDVAFEAVCVAALLLADFAPPSESLQSFALKVRQYVSWSDFTVPSLPSSCWRPILCFPLRLWALWRL